MRKILLTIAYEGTDFFGWQRQTKSDLRTVEGVILEKLFVIFKTDVSFFGASRTDTGVHACCQKATINIDSSIPTNKIPLALNSLLPKDVAVCDAVEVSDDFNCRYDVKNKTYKYTIYNNEIRQPFIRNTATLVKKKLDFIKMKEAAEFLVGTNDYTSFCAISIDVKNKVRTIYYIELEQIGDIMEIKVNGSGFLYNMVRIIVGTLIEVGLGKIKPSEITPILKSCNRENAGPTAPSEGLCLIDVNY